MNAQHLNHGQYSTLLGNKNLLGKQARTCIGHGSDALQMKILHDFALPTEISTRRFPLKKYDFCPTKVIVQTGYALRPFSPVTCLLGKCHIKRETDRGEQELTFHHKISLVQEKKENWFYPIYHYTEYSKYTIFTVCNDLLAQNFPW